MGTRIGTIEFAVKTAAYCPPDAFLGLGLDLYLLEGVKRLRRAVRLSEKNTPPIWGCMRAHEGCDLGLYVVVGWCEPPKPTVTTGTRRAA